MKDVDIGAYIFSGRYNKTDWCYILGLFETEKMVAATFNWHMNKYPYYRKYAYGNWDFNNE